MGKKTRKPRRKQNAADQWMEFLLGGFLAVYLLAVNLPGADGKPGYSGLSPMKTTLFYVLAGVMILYGIVRFSLDLRDARRTKTKLPRLTATQLAALAFLALTLVSAALSPYAEAWHNETAHEAALTVVLYVLFFLVVSRWGRPTKRIWLVLVISMVPFCLLCLLQALGQNPLGLYPDGMNFYDGYGVRYKGAYAATLGNVDIVSAFLALVIPMLVIPTFGEKLRKTWLCWVLALFCVGLLFWLRVLCGLVGLTMGAAVCLLVLCPRGKRRWVVLAYVLLGGGAVAFLRLGKLPTETVHRVFGGKLDDIMEMLEEIQALLHGEVRDTYGSGRFYIWRQMLERIPDRLLWGVGPDAVRFSGLEPFYRYDAAGKLVARATITDAHCYPLHILYCQGLPALLSWLAAVGLALTHWCRQHRDPAVAALGGGLVCFLCAMLFCFSSIIVMPFFWLTMGLLEARFHALPRLKKE